MAITHDGGTIYHAIIIQSRDWAPTSIINSILRDASQMLETETGDEGGKERYPRSL